MTDELNYTTVNHKARLELEISILEYCVADMIYHYANNPDSKNYGWCFASKEMMGRNLGISKQSVHTIINKLIKKGILERNQNTKYLKTNGAWYQSVLISSKESLPSDSKETLLPVKKLYSSSKESLPILYKDNYKDILVSKDTNEGKPSNEYGNPEINYIIKSYTKNIGHPPADKRPNYVAQSFRKSIHKFIKDNSDLHKQNFEQTVDRGFAWYIKVNGNSLGRNLDAVRRAVMNDGLYKLAQKYELERKNHDLKK